MASKSSQLPKYRHYKSKDLAVVRIGGKDFYLGKFGTEHSRDKYRRLIAEMLSSPLPISESSFKGEAGLTIDELLLAYWERRVVPYYVKDGRPTSERDNIRQALRFLRRLYGQTPARDFGPLALKAVRRSMIEARRCRRLINQDVHRIRAMFRWAAGEELYPGESLAALAAVEALAKGRSDAKDRPPIAPVAESVVRATLPHLSLQVAAMVEFQLLTAARPGEVVAIRPRDVDRSDPSSWLYRPGSHKTEHHGRERVIVVGPRASEVLTPWLDRDPEAYCFSPAEVVADRESAREPGSKPTNRPGRSAARPRPGGRYTKDSYRVAIARACDRAFPHPTIRKVRGLPMAAEQASELKGASKNNSVFRSVLLHSSPRTDLRVEEPKGCRSQSFTNANAATAFRTVSSLG